MSEADDVEAVRHFRSQLLSVHFGTRPMPRVSPGLT